MGVEMIIKHEKNGATDYHEVSEEVVVHSLREGEHLMIGNYTFACQHVVMTESQNLILPIHKNQRVQLLTNYGAVVGQHYSDF